LRFEILIRRITMYDAIIIGAGMAGMTAGIYAKRRELKTLIIASELGGQMAKNLDIENWPGEDHISGAELAQKMQKQLQKFAAEFKFEFVTKIVQNNNRFTVKTSSNSYNAKSIILAFGKTPRKLGIPGEDKFIGKGISYCVTCDGPIFRGKDVAIIGGGNSALDAALVMSKIATKVYLIHRSAEFRADELIIDKVKKSENIEIITSANVIEAIGDQTLQQIKLDNSKTLDISAMFVEIGSIVDDTIVHDLVKTDDKKQIITDDNQMTSIAGIFAAGDLSDSPYKQLVVAAGEGATAALSAYKFLQNNH